jgi:ribose 1,5-bisphosphokinase
MPGLGKPQGTMIVVVGPSGAGKDSLINGARAYFRDDPRVGFVQRVITRAADGETEDHQSVSMSEFAAMETAGMFAVWWQAHDLHYGIPARTIDEVSAGKTLIVNGSRKALSRFTPAFPSLAVIEVTARPDVIAERLKLRGRESGEEIERRLTREAGHWQPDCPFERVDNSRILTVAQQGFVEAVERLGNLQPLVGSRA